MVAWVTGVPWVEEIDVVDRGPQDTPADPTKYAPTAPPAVKSEACGSLSRLLTAVVAGEGLPVTVGRLSPYRQGHAHERLCFAMSWVG